MFGSNESKATAPQGQQNQNHQHRGLSEHFGELSLSAEVMAPNAGLFFLLDKYLYEMQRPNDGGMRRQDQLTHLRARINTMAPELKGQSVEVLQKKLASYEDESGRFFGSELSDNSDNEDENEQKHNTPRFQARFGSVQKFHQQKDFWIKTKRISKGQAGLVDKLRIFIQKHQKKVFKEESSIIAELGFKKNNGVLQKTGSGVMVVFSKRAEFSAIPYHAFAKPLTAAQEKAIDGINNILKSARERQGFLPDEIEQINKLSQETKLFVAFYRGINYMMDRWNAPSRRYHRRMDETGLPQYCEMVLRNLNFCFYRELSQFTDYTKDPGLKAHLQNTSQTVQAVLGELRNLGPCLSSTAKNAEKLYLFNNILEKLQHSYSNGINEFLIELAKLREEYPEFWGRLPNAFNPFMSTGNTAYHALKYAYGKKVYYKKPLKIRIHQSGKTEYTHVGKVYLSVRSVHQALLEDGTNNVPQLNREGRGMLERDIEPENETAFLAELPGANVVYHYVAKIPDFENDYMPIYQIKYGMDETLFNQFKYLFTQSKLHSDFRAAALEVLTEWLCTYHETILTRRALEHAINQGGTLVFLGADGFLSKTPNLNTLTSGKDNKKTREQVHVQRHLRRELAKKLQPTAKKHASGFNLVDHQQVTAALHATNDKDIIDQVKLKDYKVDGLVADKQKFMFWSAPTKFDSKKEKKLPERPSTVPVVKKAPAATGETKSNDNYGLFAGRHDIFNLTEYKSHSIDHWYNQDQIMQLLHLHFDNRDDVHVFASIDGLQNFGGTLQNNIAEQQLLETIAASEGRQPARTLVLPVNLGNQHWVALYVQFANENRLRPIVGYFDPYGHPMPAEISNALSVVFRELPAKDILVSPIKLQKDTYNCGPWLVTIFEHIILHNQLPPEGLDIEQVRVNQAAMLQQSVINDKTNDSEDLDLDEQSSDSEDLDFGEQLLIAANVGDCDTVKELLSYEDGLVNYQNPQSGYSALHHAVENNDEKMINLLLAQKGIKLDLEIFEGAHSLGGIPLHIAAFLGNLNTISKLVEADKGSTINDYDYCGYTPVHESIINGQVAAFELLVRLGADISLRTEEDNGLIGIPEGLTCEELAIYCRDEEDLSNEDADKIINICRGNAMRLCISPRPEHPFHY